MYKIKIIFKFPSLYENKNLPIAITKLWLIRIRLISTNEINCNLRVQQVTEEEDQLLINTDFRKAEHPQHNAFQLLPKTQFKIKCKHLLSFDGIIINVEVGLKITVTYQVVGAAGFKCAVFHSTESHSYLPWRHQMSTRLQNVVLLRYNVSLTTLFSGHTCCTAVNITLSDREVRQFSLLKTYLTCLSYL